MCVFGDFSVNFCPSDFGFLWTFLNCHGVKISCAMTHTCGVQTATCPTHVSSKIGDSIAVNVATAEVRVVCVFGDFSLNFCLLLSVFWCFLDFICF